MQTIRLDYEPRAPFIPFHKRRARWACLVAHRRAGKTVACVADLLDAALRCDKQAPRFAYVAPLYVQAKDVAWGYFKRLCAAIPGATWNEAELRIDLPGDRRIRLYGAENYDRMRGLYLDGVVLDEVADMPPAAWGEVIRPALADRKGWATFIGTPKGRNAFFDTWQRSQTEPDWFGAMLRASETGLLDPGELQAARAEMTPEQFEQEFECSFEAAILGAYYGRELADAERDGRLCGLTPDPALPVHTAWDLGIGDSMAIWFFQVSGAEVRVFDHYENHGQPLSHYVAEIKARWGALPQGADFVPHDARVRSLETGRTRVETLQALGRKPRLVPDHKVMDGINAARLTLARCWIDAERCKAGVEALRQYREEYDEKKRVFSGRPRHDWTSHTADAFRYLAMAWREIAPPKRPEPGRMLGVGDQNTATFDDLFNAPPKRRERI